MADQRPFSSSIRPRNFGALLDDVFRLYRSHFRFWFLASASVLIPFLVLNSLFSVHSTKNLQQLFQTVLTHSANAQSALHTFQQAQQQLGLGPMIAVLTLLEVLVVNPLLYGTLLHFVTEYRLSQREANIDESFSRSARRLFPVIVTKLLVFVLFIAVVVIVGFVIGLLIAVASATHLSWLAGILIGLLTAAVIAGVIWVGFRLKFVSSAVIEERRIGWSALVRSWQLTIGNFWRTFGFLVVVGLIVAVLQGGINIVIEGLVPNPVLNVILTGLVTLFATPFSFLARAVLYTDLRVRTDAPDLGAWLDETDNTDPKE